MPLLCMYVYKCIQLLLQHTCKGHPLMPPSIHTFAHTFTHTHIYIYIYTYVYIYIYTCIYYALICKHNCVLYTYYTYISTPIIHSIYIYVDIGIFKYAVYMLLLPVSRSQYLFSLSLSLSCRCILMSCLRQHYTRRCSGFFTRPTQRPSVQPSLWT